MKVIILAGGSGTRLWPLSREYFPKQFLKFSYLENKSLFQLTFKRALKVTKIENIFIITNEKQKFLIMGEIEELGIDFFEKNILIEPESRNTFPAIMLGMEVIENQVLIMSSDHLIKDENEFLKVINLAKELAKNSLVLFGIEPSSPNLNYGYLKQNKGIVTEFKEKPNLKNVINYIEKGFLWNSGIFLFSKGIFLEKLKKINPNYYKFLKEKTIFLNYLNLEAASIDKIMLEKIKGIKILKFNIGWSDLGSFDSIYENFEKDINLNVFSENIEFIQSSKNLVISNEKKLIKVLGINNLTIIDTPDVLLISKKDNSKNIKKIVKNLKLIDDERVFFHKIVYRPWGYFTEIDRSKNYKVKKLIVLPKKVLSLQKHKYRSENWTVVKGKAYVINGKDDFFLNESDSTFIPKGTIHRLSNKENKILEIIETQTGSYLGEDDIERIDDEYGRK